MKYLGRLMLGMAYAAVPVLGWYLLYKSFKRVKSNEISIIHDASGSARLIERGIYFRPFPGDRFGITAEKNRDYIDFGPIKRVRIRAGQDAWKINAEGQAVALPPGVHIIDAGQNETFDPVNGIKSNQNIYNDFGPVKVVRILPGFLGVKTDPQGRYVELPPGIYHIDAAHGETFDPVNGIQPVNSDDFMLGNLRYITIRDGELGESYRDGMFVLLEPGTYRLPSNHRFVKKVPISSDVVDLGALKIVTVKEGQVAVINTPEGVVVKGPGKHDIKQSEGNFFNALISTCPQGVGLPPLTVMCSDQIEMRAQSVLVFSVVEPLKTVGLGIEAIVDFLKVFADGTLRTILSRFNSSDIAPSLHTDDEHHSSKRSDKLNQLHDECVRTLDEKAREWGLRVTDLQITEILPADAEYLSTLRDLGTQQSTAEANRRQAEINASIAETNAKAGRSKLLSADISQQEAVIFAETAAKTQKIEADAEAMRIITKAQAEAEAIQMLSAAQASRITQLKEIAEGAAPIIHKVLELEAQGEILKQVKNPVFVQPTLGDTSMLERTGNGLRFFSTKKQPSALVDAAVLQRGEQLLSQASLSASL